ncbi:MAG: hypothetical protein AAGF86_04390 [Pseudomonadota bacterium]
MSIRMLSLSLPAAFLALGVIAFSTSASYATDNARDDYATASFVHTAGFSLNAPHYAKKKRHHTSRKSSGRFSGFGVRGDGFRTSGQYK